MKKLLLIIGCLLLLFFTACNKELSDNFTTYPNNPLNDTAWVKNLTNTSSIHDLFDLLVQPTEKKMDTRLFGDFKILVLIKIYLINMEILGKKKG